MKQPVVYRFLALLMALSALETVAAIRHAEPIGLVGDYHPLAKLPLSPHPFGWDEKR